MAGHVQRDPDTVISHYDLCEPELQDSPIKHDNNLEFTTGNFIWKYIVLISNICCVFSLAGYFDSKYSFWWQTGYDLLHYLVKLG
jgi:hypothetical protein